MQNNAFTVLPMSQRFNLEPGKTYKGSLSVINPASSEEDLRYNVVVTPYGVSGEDYTADLVTETNRTQISKWIEILEPTGIVKPNETKKIEFTITVPENAAGGGQYATIAVSSSSENASTGGLAIDNVFELASLVYANVTGEIIRGGEIIENNVPGFVTSAPITLSALISNEGNVHEDATFLITASNVFTGEVILPTDENDGQYNELIMPETTKDVRRELTNVPALGIVKVSQTIYYRGEVSTIERDVVICPIWFMALVVATVLAMTATIVHIIFKHKKKKRVAV